MSAHRAAAHRRPKSFSRIWSCLAATAVMAAFTVAGSQPATASLSCPLCTNFVTTYDPDGNAGPAAPITRMHRNLLVNLPYALDVNGNLPPLPLGILPLSGYELSVKVQALDASKPTITI